MITESSFSDIIEGFRLVQACMYASIINGYEEYRREGMSKRTIGGVNVQSTVAYSEFVVQAASPFCIGIDLRNLRDATCTVSLQYVPSSIPLFISTSSSTLISYSNVHSTSSVI